MAAAIDVYCDGGIIETFISGGRETAAHMCCGHGGRILAKGIEGTRVCACGLAEILVLY